MNPNQYQIIADQISFSYKRERIVDGFSCIIKKGEQILLSGPSGSGKTTFLKLISGILTPEKGEISLDTTPLRSLQSERFKLFGYHFVDMDFFESMNVEDNLMILANIQSVSIDSEWYNSLLEIFEMKPYEKTPLKELSAGQRERVSLIRAFVHKPQILILDEPGSHLDAQLQQVLEKFLIGYHQDTNATMILSSHGDFLMDSIDTIFQFHENLPISIQRK